ncbi:MAG TPA: hypothetical protein VMI75_05245 [Polyangiaceae bacterium]|nr:hypothetical protein [Polyangiaceae bacterium]
MRTHILVASAAALVACGGSTAPYVSSSAPDASSDVAIDHVSGQASPNKGSSGQTTAPPGEGTAAKPAGSGPLIIDASTGDSSSDGSADAGVEAEAGGPFACGSVMCDPPGQYCSINKTNFGNNTSYTCGMTPYGCDAGPTCACVQPFQPFDGGSNCTCTENNGAVTLTCPY